LLTGKDRWDLAVLEIHRASQLGSVSSAAGLVHRILFELRVRDTTSEVPLATGVEDPDWDFEFDRARFFVSLFAPLYPAGHSRFSGEPDVAFVLLQPEQAFRRFGVSSARPDRLRLSERVHGRFEREGQRYDLGANVSSAKALRYIKPVKAGDPLVAWWKVPIE
jgi:hypothetical protein